MTKILVPPEVLIQVSQQFHQASLQFEWTVNQLNYQMDTMLLWEGTTRQRFYADYDRARLDLKRVIELMESVSVELKGISIKFRLLDEEVSSKIASSGRSEPPPEPKTWQDHAEDVWEGVKTGGKNIADSIVDTGEALIEDPLGTIGDMAYNATIGTVEEVIDTSVWGAKMALDLGDTRDKFEESVNAAGGTSQFIGQQGAMIASNLIFGRAGLKNRRHDSGAEDGDDSKVAEGSGKVLNTVPSVRNGEFNKWFNSLTPDEFDKVWSDPNLRDNIKDRLRHPGGLHEWHLVSRADVFKRWGVTSEQIADMRTLISETKFVNPTGKHGGKGSTKAHNELLEIIDSSTDYDMFKRRLQSWANYRFEGGVDALPDGLKP
ncbi:WXG100 family type VII secretion target [Paenibacillus lemnae]|uniref:WXG100 family type VII secretion target n=1 Tax=Paenibacillus lemnae TaxID=1330551 RepID=A0A848M2L5_PAELE|nr:WXG100 family type VII secretion target [Paenibacillus lemnae]NMO94995.1 WXG100 family type VII secretion target [Paenibacillus lemnae]